MKYTQIPATAFKNIQMNAGILLDSFTPEDGTIGKILGATTGGVNFTGAPTFSDYGEDIDNCPKNMKELKNLDAWEAKMSGTFVTVTDKTAKFLVGAGDASNSYVKTKDLDIDASKTYYEKNGDEYEEVLAPDVSDISDYYELNFSSIIPRNDVLQTDFEDVWWVGDYSDENTGDNAGFCAIHLINSLSTGGFQIQSADKGKGQFSFEFTGHYSMDAQDRVPFEIFIKQGA